MNKAFAAIELVLLVTIVAGIFATTRLAGEVQNLEKYAACYPAECQTNSDCGSGYRCSAKCCIPNTTTSNPTSKPRSQPTTPPACSYGSCSNCLAAMYSSPS